MKEMIPKTASCLNSSILLFRIPYGNFFSEAGKFVYWPIFWFSTEVTARNEIADLYSVHWAVNLELTGLRECNVYVCHF